nr:DEAD/DEAH box helicase [Sporolactobacillus spathodeae]
MGIYEQIINKAIRDDLNKNHENWLTQTTPIDSEEASQLLSKYVSSVIEKGLAHLKDTGGDLHAQVHLVNQIVHTILQATDEQALDTLTVDQKAEQLLALIDKRNNIYALNEKSKIIRPETSVAESSLFTGARHEPNMFTELKKEILSCDRIDLLVSFIKWSGLRLIIDELRSFTQKGGQLRVITTSYMGATDLKAVEALDRLIHTEIKISYDTKRTRLHAKAYVFYRSNGFTTAYVGSSNLSNAALSSGLEWNVKITATDLPSTIDKISATFESYWNSSEFEPYTEIEKARLSQALQMEQHSSSNIQPYLFDIAPYPYQQEILDKLDAERKVRNCWRNLLVAATGTGKTVVAAFDYKRFRQKNSGKPCRLLFIAHREEILKQSLACFRSVLRDNNFGDLFVGKIRPEAIDQLFISIQTFNSQSLTSHTSPDFYDFIIVDEFHHAAARTYQTLLSYYQPQILLGLTATPERMDGRDILSYFDHHIAAEIRLPEAIDRKLLCPFQYFGVSDDVDLSKIKWTRGGYDRTELSNVYTLNRAAADKRAKLIIQSTLNYVTDIDDVKGLGFCVSIAHANYMAEQFNTNGIPSISLSGQSPDEERNQAKQWLISGKIRFIFVVDLYNEGVDIPEINTILFLRPTESLTVFLQQLGRGLRLADDKECLTVLDFIGQANKKYSFTDKFTALLTRATTGLKREIEEGFVSLPKGCFVQLEKKARASILENIRQSFGSRSGFISRIAAFESDSGKKLTLENFIDYYHLDVRTIYKKASFSRLCADAGVRSNFDDPLESMLTKAFLRICSIDSRRWLTFLIDTLPKIDTIPLSSLSDAERRMLRMFSFTVWSKKAEGSEDTQLQETLIQLKNNPVLFNELLELLRYQLRQIDFVDEPVPLGFDCSLDLHCSYTRDQILVALDFMRPSTVREGVKYLPDKKIDAFFITLNKSDKDYSPTTMYRDYSISDRLFHWQSQSTTADNSKTGQRYIHHHQLDSNILLFVRDYRSDLGGTAPYTFLGLADYVKHEGSRPMNIVWRLRKSIPAKFLKKTNKLIVG